MKNSFTFRHVTNVPWETRLFGLDLIRLSNQWFGCATSLSSVGAMGFDRQLLPLQLTLQQFQAKDSQKLVVEPLDEKTY